MPSWVENVLTGRSEWLRASLVMLAFGLLSLALGMVQFRIPGIPGGVSDLRETAILIATLYLPHWGWGVGVAAITSLATPSDGSVFSTFAMHACGVVTAWFFFRASILRRSGELRFGLATAGFVTVYYGAILLPVMAVTNAMAGIIEPAEILGAYLTILASVRFEMAATVAITTLFAVSHRLRLEHDRVLEQAYDMTLEGWARALELRDRETEGHTRRVADLTVRLGQAYGLGRRELVQLRRGAILHDIGKMAVPDRILLKAGEPDPEELALLREHPEHARRMLEPIPFLRPVLDIPCAHHERWDGSGYPRGLAGEEIPLAARLFAVVDVWDALLSERPYREAWTREEATRYLREGSGTLFDPRIVEVFLRDVVGREGETSADAPESVQRAAGSPRTTPAPAPGGR